MATQFRELVNPSEVQISSGHEVFLAQPVVTPIERLRRKDKEVARALEEKQRLIEEILNIPHEELESITESANIQTMGQQLMLTLLLAIIQDNEREREAPKRELTNLDIFSIYLCV